MSGTPSFRIRGAYFESCNCEAICPCRMVGGVPGGRSTYGICFGVLSWAIEDGYVEGVNLAGLNAALVLRYDDDEPGSPWSIALHVDARASVQQQAGLAHIFLDGVQTLPWIRKERRLVGVRVSDIDIDGTRVRVGPSISMTATRTFETDKVVACGIPGYDRPGKELVADELVVEDGPFSWELQGNCAFASDFDYTASS
jgi:Protein of unknown function (DUF1326)